MDLQQARASTLDSARIAKEQGLFTNYVTNGYITEEAFDMLAPSLDVYRVDIKGFSDRTCSRIGHIRKFTAILATMEKAKKQGIHVEVVTNVIPGYNDDEHELRDMAAWIKASLVPGTPWHVTRFHLHHELAYVPATPIATLERVWNQGKVTGLWCVYLGNVPGHSRSLAQVCNTHRSTYSAKFCPAIFVVYFCKHSPLLSGELALIIIFMHLPSSFGTIECIVEHPCLTMSVAVAIHYSGCESGY